MFRETRLSKANLMAPVFVKEGIDSPVEIKEMPGVFRHPVAGLRTYLTGLQQVGVGAVLLFGVPESKDELGTGAYSPDGVVTRAIREARVSSPALTIAADVCLCEYTSHGHCGVVKNGAVDNDSTLPLLAKAAVAYAEAGADIVAPSAMMDGQVGALRAGLDEAGKTETAIMGYSAKYASSFYSPFREAAGSSPSFGDRKAYQMDPPNSREAMKEIDADVAEGADIVMVKPALAYLDVISRARERFHVPLAAYNVSGEYSMVMAAARAGWLDEEAAAMEQLTAIRRAGADIVITYFAEKAAKWLEGT
jgi:porphobilinogen synthase